MVIIRPHVRAVALFRRNGEVRLFASLGDALSTLGYAWIKAHVGKDFRTFSHIDGLSGLKCLRMPTYSEHEYVMRDDFGTPLTVVDLENLRDRRLRLWLFSGYRDKWNGVGPVPGTRKWRGGRHFFRRFFVYECIPAKRNFY